MKTTIEKAQQFILCHNKNIDEGLEPLTCFDDTLLVSFIKGEETHEFTSYAQIVTYAKEHGMRIFKVWYFQDFLSLSENWPVNAYGWDSGIYGVLLVKDDSPELPYDRELTIDENAMLLCNNGSWTTNLPKLI